MSNPRTHRSTAWRAVLSGVALAACWGVGRAAVVETIISLPSEQGSVQPYLLSAEDGETHRVAAVLFTGGGGTVGLLERGVPHPGANFLVRTRSLFVAHGIATAVIDAPSDSKQMSDRFRSSERHVHDVAAVVADLQARLPGAKVFLVGTSRGTVSAAHAGANLGKAVAGVVLTSSVFTSSRGGGVGLAGFDYRSIAAPLLFVHHDGDLCPVTPYAVAAELAARYPLITAHGGDAPKSEECDPYAPHGYFGIEAPTVDAIARWMLGQEVPKRVP